MMAVPGRSATAMAEIKLDFMDADGFLVWATAQEARYELVDGLPKMMTGAKARHDRIVVNAIVALRQRLRGGPCFPHSADFAVRIPAGNVRRPDVTVDCGGPDGDALSAKAPVLVIEVLSPSTRSFDLVRKLAEYQSVPGLAHILLVDPDERAALLHDRAPDGSWTLTSLEGPDAVVPLAALGITLALSDLYE